jgi:micrococcal nuclease
MNCQLFDRTLTVLVSKVGHMKNAILIYLILLINSIVTFAHDEIEGRVISVIDGNTIEVVVTDSETYKISLHGIDCPELGQSYGDEAKDYLEKLLLNKPVRIKVQGKDRWGNRLGIISINGEDDPRYRLLQEGLAWTSEKNPIEELELIKELAREKGKGLWKEKNPIAPWIYKRQQTLMVAKSS